MTERSRTGRVPEKKPAVRKSSLFFIVITAATIFMVFKFMPRDETSNDIPRSDLQLFDDGLWSSMYRAIAHYSDVKSTGYRLESGRVKPEDTLLFCQESVEFLNKCRDAITTLAGDEERGGIPEYTQVSLSFIDAIEKAAQSLNDAATTTVNAAQSAGNADISEFITQIKACDTLMGEFREARVSFLETTGYTEAQLKSKTDTMDTMIRSAN